MSSLFAIHWKKLIGNHTSSFTVALSFWKLIEALYYESFQHLETNSLSYNDVLLAFKLKPKKEDRFYKNVWKTFSVGS